MGEVVFIDVAQKKKAVTLQAAWEAYVSAHRLSQETLNFQDGVAAGKAYKAFLDLFTGGDK